MRHWRKRALGLASNRDSTPLRRPIDSVAFDAVVITTRLPRSGTCSGGGNARKTYLLREADGADDRGCDEMIAAAERNAVILQLGFMRRFDPDFQAAKARIEAGEIGQPMLIKSLTHGPGLPPAWARDLQTSNGMLAK